MNIDEFVAQDSDFLKNINNIYISENQLKILEKYGIDIYKCNNIEELIYYIETYLNNNELLDDLEWVSESLSEYNYYCNTNK